MHSQEPILIGVLVLFSLLGMAMIVVIYGTFTKRKWGINLDPVACPRCGTSAPAIRQPASRQQALWGGWTCEVCGTEFDKWGREVAVVGPPPRNAYRTEGELRSALRKRVLLGAAVAFPPGVILDFYVKGRGIPTSWTKVAMAAGDSLLMVGMITATVYFALERLFVRRLRESKPPDAARSK